MRRHPGPASNRRPTEPSNAVHAGGGIRRRTFVGGGAFACATLMVLALASPAAAQEGIGAKIKRTFELTKTAKTEQDYTRIIQQCRALRDQTEKADRVQYLTSLLSWGLNKRGELYAAQAVESESARDAAALDERALQDFEAAVQANPQRWRAYHNRGVSYALIGRLEEAEADFTAALQINSDYANSWFNRAELRSDAGRYEQAAADYTEVLRISPDDTAALRGRAECRLQTGMTMLAIEDASTAIRVQPSVPLLLVRGRAYQTAGRWEQAAADYRGAVALDKSSVEAYCAVAWLAATCPERRFRDGDVAVKTAQRARELEEQQRQEVSAETYDVLAAAHASAGSSTKAVQLARAAVQHAGSQDQRNEIQQRLKLYEQGRPYRLAMAAGSSGSTRR